MLNNPAARRREKAALAAEIVARLSSPQYAHIGQIAALWRGFLPLFAPAAIRASLPAEDKPLWAALWPDNDAADHADLVDRVINTLTPAAPEGEAVLAGQVLARLMAEGEGGQYAERLAYLARVYGPAALAKKAQNPEIAEVYRAALTTWQAAFNRVIAFAEGQGDHETAEVYRAALARLATSNPEGK